MSRYTQLKMQKRDFKEVVIIPPPSGYEVRTYQEGDEAAWVDIINASFNTEEWNDEMVHEKLIDLPQFDPEGLFFIKHEGKLVGTCCAWRAEDKSKIGYVHWLGVTPKHQKKRLGLVLVLHVLNYFKKKGFRKAMLDTDDFRLPAIKTYLELGFESVYIDENHQPRWKAIMEKIGSN